MIYTQGVGAGTRSVDLCSAVSPRRANTCSSTAGPGREELPRVLLHAERNDDGAEEEAGSWESHRLQLPCDGESTAKQRFGGVMW